LEQFHEEIAEYERLRACEKSKPSEIVVENFNKRSDALIKARMAVKMSEEELAEIWDFAPERIKEYEKKNIKILG
jgi:hypothetical protein